MAMTVDMAERVPLGRTGLRVTRLGLGLAPIGGLYRPVDGGEARAAVDRAWAAGIRLFDTAPLYGYGLSEQRAGAALAGHPRDGYVLSTKVGRLLEPGETDRQGIWPQAPAGVAPRFDFSAPAVRRSLAESLGRLGVDRIDVAHLHDPDDHYHPALTQAYPELARLRAEGVVGAVGLGVNAAPLLARFIRDAPPPGLDCAILAGRYTLLDQSGLDEALPLAAERGVAVLAAGVFNSGLLADPAPGARYDYAPAPRPLLDRALALRTECERHGVPLRAAALQFPLGHPAVTCVLVGAASSHEVADAVAMLRHPVPPELWASLKARGLLRASAPTP